MKKIVSLVLLLSLILTALASCGGTEQPAEEFEERDFAASFSFEKTSSTAKCLVEVKTFIDGDTTHFTVPKEVNETGVLKARYLAINTPESTGKIEEWGKKASNFTKDKLLSADEIWIESDDENWNADSTGGRYLVWVWYRVIGTQEWRNLNIEILQNGLAIASSAANNRYGETAVKAIEQARQLKLNIYSGEKDPDFYYGTAQELTLKELRTNISKYNGSSVAFEGVITMNDSNTVYIEDYDAETGTYFGMAVYYGYNLAGEGLEILSVGNRARIVGTVQYYEAGDSWQVSGLNYRQMKPNDPGNIQKISSGNSAAYFPVTADYFVNGKINVTTEEGTVELPFAESAVNTSISMQNLVVKSIYTTDTAGSSSVGAMTLTCECDGLEIKVRTTVLYDADGKLVTADRFDGKTIDVRGVIDRYNGSCQIKVLSLSNITIK